MKVGDLVSYRPDGDLGIIFDKDATGMYHIQWSDGKNGWHIQSELEKL